MSISASPSLYNQDTLPDDDFVANFVARHDVLGTLMRRLRSAEPGGRGLHHILVGSRGMGKTSLLRRLSIAINQEGDLAARYIPLRFREEQYNVLTLGDFWRNCGEALAEWAEAVGRTELADRLDAAMAGNAWSGDDGSAAQFHSELAALRRRAVLLVDNLDLILNAFSSHDHWTLRRHLQEEEGPIMIGAATQPLKESAKSDAAFYEFFQPHYLDPLNERETEICMRALAGRRGEQGKPVIKVLNKQPERLQTLHTLTGGNPRVLALIYRLLESGESDAAMADLEILLDQVTPYYKARIEEYQTAQQRAVIDAIALNWDPVTTGELSRLTNVASTTLSPLLIKLRKDGLIENVETSGSYAGHQVVERFLNIWYLMRHGTRRTKQKMRWLVGFLTSFYSSQELVEIASRAESLGLAKKWNSDYAFAFEEALGRQNSRSGDDGAHRRSLATGLTDQMKGTTAERTGAALDARLQLMHDRLGKALGELENRDLEGCLTSLHELIDAVGGSDDPMLLEGVAMALLLKASVLAEQGETASEMAVYDEVLARFGHDQDPRFGKIVALALRGKAVALDRAGNTEAEVAVYDEIIAKFQDSPVPEMREPVAEALVLKAITIGQAGRRAEERAIYDQVIANFREDEEPAVREQVAMALVNKGHGLGEAGDEAAELAVYDEVIARFGDSDRPALINQVGIALVNKAITIGRWGDHETEIALYDDVISRVSDAENPPLRDQLAKALVYKAVTLGKLGKPREAIAAFDQALERIADVDDPELRVLAAKALVGKGAALGEAEDLDAVVATVDETVARFGESANDELRRQVAMALSNKAVALDRKRDNPAVLAVAEDIIARFDGDEDPALRERVAEALVNKGATLGEMGRIDAAMTACLEVVERFGASREPSLRKQVAMALTNHAVALNIRNDLEAAIAVYDEIYSRLGDADEPDLRELVPPALLAKASTLARMGDEEAAAAVYEQVLEGFPADGDERIGSAVAEASIRLANHLLDVSGETERSEALYLQAAGTKSLLARVNLAWLYVLTDRIGEAEQLRGTLTDLPPSGLDLLDAGVALAKDNFGTSTSHLAASLDSGLVGGEFDFSIDLDRLFRLAQRKGYGERFLSWFEATGYAERFAPLYAAFKAFIRGENVLLDVNPEVRQPAEAIYRRLQSPRRTGPQADRHRAGTRRKKEQTREAGRS